MTPSAVIPELEDSAVGIGGVLGLDEDNGVRTTVRATSRSVGQKVMSECRMPPEGGQSRSGSPNRRES